MGKECLLQLQNVTKRYGDKIALNNFSMDICPGEIVALIGENGAGKTTLLNIICGYIKPSAGQVQYKGENIIEKPLAIREFGILIEPQLLVCVGTYMILYIIMNLMSYMDGIKYLSYCCSFLKYPTVHILHNDFFPLYYLYGNFIYPHWYS